MSILLLLVAPIGAPAEPAHSLASYIEKLGTEDAASQLRYVDRYGCAALPILLKHLHVVPRGHFLPTAKSDPVMQSIYVVASLRYITGRDYYGNVSRKDLRRYDSAGRQFLTDGAPRGHAKFFGWWMSRGSFYLAPEPAQKQIIANWKAYARSGACKHSTWLGRTSSRFYLGGIR